MHGVLRFKVSSLRGSLHSIRKTWNKIKDTFFDGKENKLHAKDLFQPKKIQINAISDFFKKNKFARVAAVMSNKIINKTEYDIYNLVTRVLYKRVLEVQNGLVLIELFLYSKIQKDVIVLRRNSFQVINLRNMMIS